MAYVKIIYQNSPSTATPINAQNLNHMDDGIAENDRRLNELETAGVVNKFNNRTGNVTPEKNDYDISLIGATAGEDGYVPVWRNSGTEENPNWGFEMEQQGGSGHKILDADGSEMAQEDSLQFADSFVSDDDVNGKTVVENIKEHSTKADYDDATEDGFHVIDDGEDAVIHPSSDDYVEVEADGDTTYTALLNELFTKIDSDKLKEGSTLVTIESNFKTVYKLSQVRYSPKRYRFECRASVDNTNYMELLSSGSSYKYVTSQNTTPYNDFGDNSTNKPANHVLIRVYYGNKKAVVDLQTTANRCLLTDEETTVEQAMYVQSHGSQTVIEQSSWVTTTGDTTVTATHTGYLIGTFNAHSCTGGGAFTHGVIVFIDSIPVANIYSQGTGTAEANSGSFCIPIKKGQDVIVRVNNGTWLGKAYIRY